MAATSIQPIRTVVLPDAVMRRLRTTEDGCWHVGTTAYPRIVSGGSPARLFRYLWEQINGPVPDGLLLDHVCHTFSLCRGNGCSHQRCIHPGHLELVTRAENNGRARSLTQRVLAMDRAVAQGRWPAPEYRAIACPESRA